MFRRFSVAAVTIFAILFFANLLWAAQPQLMLTSHVPAAVANGKAQLLGHLPADQVLRFDIVIPLRDQPGLELFLQDLYNPSSPFYHLFVTPDEFTQRFGPSQEDWDALVAFAKASGFQIFSGSCEERDLRAPKPQNPKTPKPLHNKDLHLNLLILNYYRDANTDINIFGYLSLLLVCTRCKRTKH